MEGLTVSAIPTDIMESTRISSEALYGISNSVSTIANLGGVAETFMNTKDLIGEFLFILL